MTRWRFASEAFHLAALPLLLFVRVVDEVGNRVSVWLEDRATESERPK